MLDLPNSKGLGSTRSPHLVTKLAIIFGGLSMMGLPIENSQKPVLKDKPAGGCRQKMIPSGSHTSFEIPLKMGIERGKTS